MKKITSCIMIMLILLSALSVSAAPKSEDKLAKHAKTAVVIDMTSDYVLFEKDMHKKMFPASMTKLMTAIVTVENKSMDDTTVVTESAIGDINKYESTNVDLNAGDVLTVDELMHALLIPSANDAANVLAEFVGGSEEEFVKMMNKKAKELGCKNTNFVNANGLHDDNHYTTAYDMALIAKAAMQRNEIADLVSLWSYESSSGYTYASTNHLVSRYVYLDYYFEKATGIKTGYTDQAKRTLAASASDGKHSIITVVMGCEDGKDGTLNSFVDAKELLEYYLESNQNMEYIAANQIIEEREVKNASGDGRVLLVTPVTREAYLPKDTKEEDIVTKVHLDKELTAPIKMGETVGYADIFYKDTKISTVELKADRDIEKSYFKAFFNAIGGFAILAVLGIILVALFITAVVIRQINLRKRRKRREARMRELKRREEEEKNEFRFKHM